MAKINPTRVPRGETPLLRQRTWMGAFPPVKDPEAIAPYWQITKSGNANTKREPGRVLRIHDRGSGGGEFAHLGRTWALTPERRAEIEVTLRVVACTAPGGCMLRIADGQSEEAFTFFPDRVLANRSGLTAPVDLASDFTTLRITVDGSGFQLFAGEDIVLDGRNRFTSPANGGRRVIHFGCGSSGGKGEALWKRVHYRIVEERD